MITRRASHIDTEYFGQLGQANDQGCGIGKPDDDRMGEKIHHHPETKDAKEQLKGPHHEGHEHGQGNILGRQIRVGLDGAPNDRRQSGRCHD